ncbi:PD-(D/E)XK nuclease family protein [Microbacterium sp.]|uniref:PD-(D/E)XK nuclease family protein n=1 Tax=Microbacterium sp. TaxID=51671 RepID=UPI003A84286E
MPAATPDLAQRRVLELPRDASGVVVGAAGSGKTETIVQRVRRLVADGLPPDGILVLTPTRHTATALRDRLAMTVNVATRGALARSLSAFAFAVVRAAVVHEGANPPQLLTGPDEDQILHDLLDGDAADEADAPSRWPAWIGPDIRATGAFRAELRAFLAECLTLGIDAERLADLGVAEDREAWSAVASFALDYQRVRASMRADHRDAAGLVREAVARMREAPAGGILERLRVLIVDDAQELTAGGVELLEACRARGIAVLAFGDPDVGSGGFRGAGPENFARLAAGTALHVLDGAHRGTGFQRDVLAAVTARIGATGVVDHRRAPQGAAADGSVRAHALRSVSEEADTIARFLRERHVHDGVAWHECAVIAHDTRQVAALEGDLAARDVPTAGTAGRPLADRRAVRDLVQLVLMAAQTRNLWSPEAVTAALTGAGIDPVALRRLRATLRHDAARSAGDEPIASGAELLASGLEHPIEFETLDIREGRRAARVGRAIARLREQLADDATAHELLWTVWEETGRSRDWPQTAAGHGPVAEQARRDIDAVVALFQAAKRHGERGDGTGPLAFIRGILDSDVAEDRLAVPPPGAAVRVLTPAAALGTEFDTVVVAGVQDGVWPNLRTRGSLLDTWRLASAGEPVPDAVDRRRAVLHDELRLFARAVSRARCRLLVTAVADDDTGPSGLFEFLPPALPAPAEAAHPLSLRGLVAAHRRTLTTPGTSDAERDAAAGQLRLLAEAGADGADPEQWYGVADPSSPATVAQAGTLSVSPSRVQTLEVCPLDWVIGELGGDAGSTVAGVGTLVHSALEVTDTADEYRLWAAVEARWGELEFEAGWRERAEKARTRDLVRRLAAYLRDFDAAGGTLLSAEPRFSVPIPDPDGAGVTLNGFIDRVEHDGDGTVVIVDLKTGKREPQTDAKVADHPQLASYQLAFEAGAIPAARGLAGGGAKLLVLRPTAASKVYVTPRQPPFDDETRRAFLERLAAAVRVMRGEGFVAPFEQHCRDDHTYGLCRIHTVRAVSAT